jgi:hypothetical protein
MRSHGNRTSRRTNQAAPFTGRGVPADCKSAQPISGRGPLLFSFVGCGNASFTKFNGIPFGKTHKEVMPQIEKILSEQGYKGKARKSSVHFTGLTRYIY